MIFGVWDMVFSVFQIIASLILFTLITILSVFSGGDLFKKGIGTLGEVSITEDLKRLRSAYYYIYNEGIVVSEHDDFVRKVMKMKLLPKYPDYNGMTYVFKKTEGVNPLIFFVLKGYDVDSDRGISEDTCSKINKRFFGFGYPLKISSLKYPYLDSKENIARLFSVASNKSIKKDSIINVDTDSGSGVSDSSTLCFESSGLRSIYYVINPSNLHK